MFSTTRPEIGQTVKVKTREGNWEVLDVRPSYDGSFVTLRQGLAHLITHTDDVTHINGVRI